MLCKKETNNKLNGSVLYTVVAVIMIMTVFIFTALSLAVSANRRAYNSYANNQTNYTAKSVIDSMLKVLEENGPKAVGSLDVDKLNQSISDSSMGKVKSAKIEKLGTFKELNEKGYEFDVNLSEDNKKTFNIYKLSATVDMLGQENTVSLYCYNGREDDPPIFNHSLTVLGDLFLDDSSNIHGSAYAYIENPGDVSFSAGTEMDCEFGTQGSINLGGGGSTWILPRKGIGIYADGNLNFTNGGMNILSTAESNIKYKELPYIYAENNIDLQSKSDVKIGSQSNPLIIMADSINQSGNKAYPIYADMYLFGSNPSDIVIKNTVGGFKQWNSNYVKKNNNEIKSSYTGGNIYSLGDINVRYSGGVSQHDINTSAYLANNMVADEVTFEQSSALNGSAVLGSAKIINGNNYAFNNGLFVDPDNYESNYEVYVNGENYYKPLTETHWQTIYSEDFNVSNEAINNQYVELKTNNKGVKLDVYFDFSDSIPDDAEKVVVEPTSIVFNTAKNKVLDRQAGQFVDDTYYSDECKIYADFYGKTGTDTYGNYSGYRSGIIGVSGTSIAEISDLQLDYSSGKVSIKIEPSAWQDEWEEKGIIVESLSINFKVTAQKSYIYIVDRVNNTEYLRAVNDVAFNNNSNVIYIDDIDKSVKLEKFTDAIGNIKLKISKADLTSVEEGNELSVTYSDVGIYDYYTEYAQFLRGVVSTATYPESMKKENVVSSNGGFVKDEFLQEELLNRINANSKSYEDVKDYIEENITYEYDKGAHKIRGYKKNEQVKEVNQLDESFKTFEINTSCTLIGTFNLRGTLNINPGDSDIYISLINFYAQDLEIVINNSGKGKVFFMVPRNGIKYKYYYLDNNNVEQYREVTSNGSVGFNQSSLVTKTYYDLFKSADANLLYTNPADKKKIPNIYFYMDDLGNDGKFQITNGALISAYINAPTATFEKGADMSFITADVFYNDQKIYMRNGNIGGAIFKKANIGNPFAFVYVNENGALKADLDENDFGDFYKLYYQNY